MKRDKKEKVVYSFSVMHQMKRRRKKTDGRSSFSRKKKPPWGGSMKIKTMRKGRKEKRGVQ